MCELEELSECALDIIVDLIMQMPSKRVLALLLSLSMSRNNTTRKFAVEKTMLIYEKVDIFKSHIENHSVDQMQLIVGDKPPENLGDVWTENEATVCLALVLELLPHKHGIKQIHIPTKIYFLI